MKKIAITGAAGNLGGLLAHEMKSMDVDLNLLIHHTDVPDTLKQCSNVKTFRVDLAKEKSLLDALEGVDTVVHFAGVLFKPNPDKFLPVTNTHYFHNLLYAVAERKVKRVILISFPHVEGETAPGNPATGMLTAEPESTHAYTRLEEEKLLFLFGKDYHFEPVVLRVGMVYGKGILMIDAAQWLAKRCLLGVWKKPTYIHLISKDDFLKATIAAALKPGVQGIYHIGDEGVQTLQQFLDDITAYKGHRKPWRMPVWMIISAARCTELFATLFKTRSPLTVDFVRIGMASYYGDSARMREELLPELTYKTYKEGMELF